jgi:SH3-like domain-containing protein
MQAPRLVAVPRLVLLLALAATPALGQTTTPPRGEVTPQHPAKHADKPAPVIEPHGPTHAQKVPAEKKAAEKKGAEKKGAKAAARPVPPPAPVAAPPAPAPEPAPAPPAEPTKGSVTGYPLPRFAALRTDEVNLRRGPGTRYPIDWVYKRRDLPVEIEREFEVWRLIVDPDGIKGWVHQATLTGRRSFIVTGGEQVLRHDPSDTSAPVARLKPGVIGHIRSCEAASDWCQMQVGEYRGYLKRDAFWGALPHEAIND